MEIMAGIVLALGLSFLAEFQNNIIFRLGSAITFLWLAFNIGDVFMMIPFIGISIYQFYQTYMEREE